MRVKPASGLKVRDAKGALLPEEGREVPDHDLFWIRRIRDGDVVVEEAHSHHRRRHPQQHEPGPAREA